MSQFSFTNCPGIFKLHEYVQVVWRVAALPELISTGRSFCCWILLVVLMIPSAILSSTAGELSFDLCIAECIFFCVSVHFFLAIFSSSALLPVYKHKVFIAG